MKLVSKYASFIGRRFRFNSGCDYYLPKLKLMSSCAADVPQRPVRVRFAPSPTGQLHLGGLRTALLNHLFAKKHGGAFILRIEDTDQTRLVPDALENIEIDLRWLGIVSSEGPSNSGKYGPYIQSQRLSLYQENLSQLIEAGHAYECFCSEKRLDLLRREALKLRQKPRYDNKCRDLTREEVKRKKGAGEQYCVRFKLCPEEVVFNDLVFGQVEYNLSGMNYEGDPVIMKSDGYPTYHYANVVDDHYMEITHVLRGIEWQISTPKHLQLYKAFSWNPPKFAHLPLVLNKDGTKLSKRQGDISISHFRSQAYYAAALANFVTKSGGGFSHSNHDIERLYTQDELAEDFDMGGVNRGGCRLDFILLEQLNQLALQAHISTDVTSVLETFREIAKSKSIELGDYSSDYLVKILQWCPERVYKVQDLVSSDFEYLWSKPNVSILSKVKTSPAVIQNFITSCTDDLFAKSAPEISAFLEQFSESHSLRHTTFLKDLRALLCGISKGPPIVEIFYLFGRNMILDRLNSSLEYISKRTERSTN